VVLSIFFLLILVFSPIINYFNSLRKISIALAFLLPFLTSGFVQFTPDWEFYEYMIDSEVETDLFFMFIIKFFKIFGIAEYKYIHLFFIFTTSIVLINFISQFNSNTYLISFCFLIIFYLVFTTQIRYFLAYFSFLNSIFLYWKGYKKKALGWYMFSASSHLSVIILAPMFYYIRRPLRVIKNDVIFISLITFVITSLIVYVLPEALYSRFILYFDKEHKASIIGSIYFFSSSLINLALFLTYIKFYFLKCDQDDGNSLSVFLLKGILIPYFIFGLALNIQVFGSRFIEPTFILLVIFYLLEIKKSQSFTPYIFLFILIFSTFLINYILSYLVLGNPSYFALRSIQVLISNKLYFD
jgi:hypothetical protein